MSKFFLIVFLAVAMGLTFLSCGDKVTVMSVIKDGEELNENSNLPFLLNQNYPNPFNRLTSIQYQVIIQMHLRMRVYTDDWQLVKTLINTEHSVGSYIVHFNGWNSENKPLPSGEYFYTLEGNGITLVRKMKLIK